MCGITGFIHKNNASSSPDTLVAMNHSIKHRGPDDEGYFIYSIDKTYNCYGPDSQDRRSLDNILNYNHIKLGLGFRRLSILDLSSAGHQPMIDDQHRLTITFNGEIFNYKNLKFRLEQLGHQFKSNTDTEVILQGYIAWGNSIFAMLDGMFAIVIYDHNKQEIVFARDRMGIKPLYIYQNASIMVWCSEIKGILKHPAVQKSINWLGVVSNFYLQSTPMPHTCFTDIKPFPSAHFGIYNIQQQTYKTTAYWSIPKPNEYGITLSEAEEEIANILTQNVAAQLVADVPVTTFLSGGIDSSLITSIAKSLQPNISAYTLGLNGYGVGNDEIPQARAIAQKINVNHHIQLIQADDVVADLDATLRHYEDPYNDIEVLNSACEYVHQQGYKVVLNGNGADELFGGYPYVMQYPTWQKTKKLVPIACLIPKINELAKKVKNKLNVHTALDFYASNKATMRKDQIQKLWPKNPLHLATIDIEQSDATNDLLALFENDMMLSVTNHHVLRDDLSAMRHSVELRYPYLGNELVDFIAALPLNMRYNFQTNKPLLRSVAKPYIHEDNLSMKKKGFSLPMGIWMQEHQQLNHYVYAQLQSLKKRHIFNNETIDVWWQYVKKPYDYHKIWQLLTFEIWLQTYID